MSTGAHSPALNLVSVCAKPPQTFLFEKLRGTAWFGVGMGAGLEWGPLEGTSEPAPLAAALGIQVPIVLPGLQRQIS